MCKHLRHDIIKVDGGGRVPTPSIHHVAGQAPLLGVTIVGDVDIVQRQPLAHRGRDDRFTAPPIPYDSEDPEDFLISKILQDYAERLLSSAPSHKV